MSLNSKIGCFSVLLRFSAAAYISKVNWAKMAGDTA